MSLPDYSVGQKLAVLDKLLFGSSSGCGAPMMYTTPMSPEPPRTNKLPNIYAANQATFIILVHSRYTRMAGFGRREIEYMQALCIYNKYIECYSVKKTVLESSAEEETRKSLSKSLDPL